MAARLFAPSGNYEWLAALTRRLAAKACPMERLSKLKMPWDTLALGLSLMDRAMKAPPRDHRLSEIEFRDGLIVALLSLWPIRRRSMAALTVTGHIVRSGRTLTINLFGADTKTGRPGLVCRSCKAGPLHCAISRCHATATFTVRAQRRALGLTAWRRARSRRHLPDCPQAHTPTLRHSNGNARLPSRRRNFTRHRGPRQNRTRQRPASTRQGRYNRPAL